RFHHDLTPAKLDAIIDSARAREGSLPSPPAREGPRGGASSPPCAPGLPRPRAQPPADRAVRPPPPPPPRRRLPAPRPPASHQAWIYIRSEYDGPHGMLVDAIEELRAEGILGARPFGQDYALDVQLYRGHGAYICGEETGLLESLEGKRAQPRSRPPFPAVKGAWGRPTLLNNVETLSNLPWIVRHGGEEYAKFGTEKSKGTRMLSVSGNVRKPGVYEVELGQSFRHVIMELAGGVTEGRSLKVFWPGGSSAPVLPA